MKVVELFAGVGGFRLGLERAGHEVVWANEWDKYAAKTYNKNFGDNIDQRDITTIPAGDIPSHDLICGGFPCQAFSVAGKRRGFDETRGTLFFEIMRIARHHRTPYLFLENVKGLLSHDSGRTFETILRTLDELGYDCQWQVLNSKDFGVPQNRERIIIVGHLRGQPRPQVFPLGEDHRRDDAPSRGEGPASLSLTTRSERYDPTAQTYIANTITTKHNPPSRTQRRTHENYIASVRVIGHLYEGVGQAGRVYDAAGISPTLSTMTGGGNKQPKIEASMGIRRLTPLECERLQGFPDNWTLGVGDAQRYKQMGNAVTVNVIEAVARKLSI